MLTQHVLQHLVGSSKAQVLQQKVIVTPAIRGGSQAQVLQKVVTPTLGGGQPGKSAAPSYGHSNIMSLNGGTYAAV